MYMVPILSCYGSIPVLIQLLLSMHPTKQLQLPKLIISQLALPEKKRKLSDLNDKKGRCESHYAFVTRLQKEKIIPDGLKVYLESSVGNHSEEFLNNCHERLQSFSLTLMSDVLTF